MKSLLITLFTIGILGGLSATDPIPRKTFYLELDFSYSFYHHYNQVLFKKQGLAYGGAISLGHRSIPFSLEYQYQAPISFSYINNHIKDQFQELGLRYNLNHLTYVIPYGIDPYLGVGIMSRVNQFTQYDLEGGHTTTDIVSSLTRKIVNYKLSAGVKMGNRNFRIGIHYDYLPKGLQIPNAEGANLEIYNSMHIISARVGIRLNQVPSNKIRCPRFNKRQKRTLAF